MYDPELTDDELASLQANDDGDATADEHGTGELDEQDSGFFRQDPVELRRQLDALESFHQDLSGRFSDALSRGLQRLVEVQMVEVQAISYSQFAFGRTTPTCYAVVHGATLPTPLALDVSPGLLYPLLDCLLGGGKHPCPPPDRPLTELEQRLARRIIRMLLDELHDAWEPLLAVDLSIERLECHAQRVRVVAPADHVISVTYRVHVAEQAGDFALCLPTRAIRKIVDKLLAGEYPWGEGGSPGGAHVDDATVELVAYFEAESIAPAEFDHLRAGDVLLSDMDVDGLVEVAIDGRATLKARPGVLNGHRAVAIMPKSN